MCQISRCYMNICPFNVPSLPTETWLYCHLLFLQDLIIRHLTTFLCFNFPSEQLQMPLNVHFSFNAYAAQQNTSTAIKVYYIGLCAETYTQCFISLSSKYSSQHRLNKHSSSSRMWVSNPCKNTSEIVNLCVLVFTRFMIDETAKVSDQNGRKHYRNAIC
jgi:hypothetical protein